MVQLEPSSSKLVQSDLALVKAERLGRGRSYLVQQFYWEHLVDGQGSFDQAALIRVKLDSEWCSFRTER